MVDQRRMFDADRLDRFRGGAPKMVPMVVEPSGGGLASRASSDAWAFFTGQLSPPEDQRRFSKWCNEITLRSLELYSEYEPGSFVRTNRTDAAIDGGRGLGRGMPHRPCARCIQPSPRTRKAGALSRDSLCLYRSVRSCCERGHTVVRRISVTWARTSETNPGVRA